MADPIDAVRDAELARLLLAARRSRGPSPTSARRQVRQRRSGLRPGGEQDINAFLLDQAPDGDDGRRRRRQRSRSRARSKRIGQEGELPLGTKL